MQVIDFHCDTLSCLRRAQKERKPVGFLANDLQIDLGRMRRGDYLLQCFAAFVYLKEPEASPLVSALEQIDIFYRMMRECPDEIGPVRCWADLEGNRREGRMSALLTVEEGGACMGSLPVLRMFYELGVRIMTLTWNFPNELAWPNVTAGSGFSASRTPDTEHGLTERGLAFLAEMEQLGIIVDVSHLSDAGFWDVARHTKRPFIASHSNARAVCGHVRNLTDEMLRTIGERGGLTGINYYGAFLDEQDDPAKCRSTVAKMADHIEHIRQVGGIEMIGLGSDFDGIDGELEMKDCSCLPLLASELHRRHYSDDAIEKIFHGNALRVLHEFL